MLSISTGRRRPAAWLLLLTIIAACSAGVDRIVGPKLLPSDSAVTDVASPSASGVIISQVYGGGGNLGATLKNDYVELYNGGSATVTLAGWSVQYASATGTTWQITPLAGTLAPGHYYLVQESAGTGGTTALPAPDATGSIAMSATAGKVALVTSTTGLTGTGCPFAASVADFVGFGSTANCYEGPTDGTSGPTTTLTNTTAAIRKNSGLVDNNDNKADFIVAAPTPHNSTMTGPVSGALDHVAITGGAATVSVGASVQFTASGQDASNGSVSSTITWVSADPASVTVDNTGKATGVVVTTNPVTLTATAVANGVTKTATTTVSVAAPAPVKTVTVSPATWTLKAGQTKTFTASATDDNDHPTTTTFTWSSADPLTADIDASTGLLTAKKIGTVTITATSANGKTGTASVTVTSASNVSLTSGKTSLALGMQTQFFFSGTDASGNKLTTVAWSTSDPTVITVDDHGIVTGKKLGTATLTATAPDGSAGSVGMTVYLAAGSSGVRLGHNTEFGEPKDADPNDDFIIRRAQYTVSYNPLRGGANWVSWNLDVTHVGDSGRCTGTCYSADTVLTNAGLTAYTTNDWVTGNLYDRGHMAPSADWTSSEADNNTTFFLSNFLPQTHDLNAGPWERLENALRDTVGTPLAPKGREVYLIAGGIFTHGVGLGTINGAGRIGIPDSTWKIAVITPSGTGLNADGTLPPNSTVLAVNMPNVTGISNDPFEKYLTSVAKIEASTGYNFLALLAETTQCRVEQRNCPPSAHITGRGVAGGLEGQTLAFDASTSTDPEGDALTYAWSIDGQPVGSQASLSHTFADNGSYSLRLIATDSHGAADTTNINVAVQNVAPSVSAIPAGASSEGSVYSATGSFIDPGDDHWMATADYGDGSGPQALSLNPDKTFTLSHSYANNGNYTVTVTVTETDPEAASGSVTTTVAVANVAPVVGAFDGATILRGEHYVASGAFSDPGADTWTATVNYGDGSGTSAIALAGKTFSLDHVYGTAGLSTVTVYVADGDGGSGTRTAQVTVLSAAQGMQALSATVSALAADGRMDADDAKWLVNKLDVAARQITKTNVQPTLNQLQEILDRIGAAQSAGRLSSADAATLSAYVIRLVASIS